MKNKKEKEIISLRKSGYGKMLGWKNHEMVNE